MNDRQENYLSMCKAVQQTLNNNTAWSSTPAFVTTFAKFNDLVSDLEKAVLIQETDITGFTQHKNEKRNKVIENALRVSACLSAYSRVNLNFGMLKQVEFSRRKLIRARDEIFTSYIQILIDNLAENLNQLGDYNFNSDDLNNLQTLFDEYKSISQISVTKRSTKKAATKSIKEIIIKLREVLKIMDLLSHGIFYSDKFSFEVYKNSRKTHDLKRKKIESDIRKILTDDNP